MTRRTRNNPENLATPPKKMTGRGVSTKGKQARFLATPDRNKKNEDPSEKNREGL